MESLGAGCYDVKKKLSQKLKSKSSTETEIISVSD